MNTALDTSSLIDDIYLDRELSARGYRHFIPIAWKYVEPSQPFVPTWGVDAVADHLQAVNDGEILRLIINVPPGTTKSLSACVFFPSWAWTNSPGKRFIYGSYNDKLAVRDAVRCRRLVDSTWYQDRWGDTVVPYSKDAWSAQRFSIVAGGSRLTTTIAGGVTGEHADIQVVDDPHKPYDLTGSLSVAETSKKAVSEWWRSTMATRSTNIAKTARVIIMQRLAGDDLAGEMIDSGEYEVLTLPMRYEAKRKCFTSIGFEDPRTEEGELLDPIRFPEEPLKRLEKELGPRAVQAQLQQNPVPSEGTIFKTYHFRNRFDSMPTLKGSTFIQSWDATFGDSGDSYVSGLIWASSKDRYYLLDRVKARLTFTQTIRAIKSLTSMWPQALIKLVEKKANGAAIIDSLSQEVSGLIPITPTESKKSRANAVEPLFDLGKVWLPSEDLCPWIVDYEHEMKSFTGEKGEVNDQVDATTQALMHFMRGKNQQVKKALGNMKNMGNYGR